MLEKDVRVSREVHELIKTYKRSNEAGNDFIHRALIFYIENSDDVYLPRHQIVKAMILEEPEDMEGKVAVDIKTVDFQGKELARNWAIYDTIEEAEVDQLPSTKGKGVFKTLKKLFPS